MSTRANENSRIKAPIPQSFPGYFDSSVFPKMWCFIPPTPSHQHESPALGGVDEGQLLGMASIFRARCLEEGSRMCGQSIPRMLINSRIEAKA